MTIYLLEDSLLKYKTKVGNEKYESQDLSYKSTVKFMNIIVHDTATEIQRSAILLISLASWFDL